MDSWARREPLQPESSRNSLGGSWCMNSSHISETGADVLRHGSATYKPKDCWRFTGAPLPPNGTPIPTHSLENLNERLERLAFGRRPEGFNSPPLETYTVTTTENGDVVRATPEYIRWFLRAYPAAGPENRLSRAAPRPAPEGVGRKEKSPLSHFQAT
jgi:hypothetical protein